MQRIAVSEPARVTPEAREPIPTKGFHGTGTNVDHGIWANASSPQRSIRHREVEGCGPAGRKPCTMRYRDRGCTGSAKHRTRTSKRKARAQVPHTREMCNRILLLRGYEQREPTAFSPGPGSAGLHLVGTRSDYEVLCVRVCRTGCPVSPDIAEFLSWQDVCALRAASPDVPLFIVLHMIMKRIRRHGENLEWVIVRKSGSHYYNISIRTRSVKRELKEGSTGAGTSARVAKCGERA